VVKGGRL